MTARKSLLSILIAVCMVFALTPMTAGAAYAGEDGDGDDSVYTITFSPGNIGGESVTISSNEEGRMADDYWSAEPGQFYKENELVFYKVKRDEINPTVPEGYYFYDWDCSGRYDNMGNIVDFGYDNDITMTALWTDWTDVEKTVTVTPGEIGGDPITIQSTDAGRIAGNQRTSKPGQFYPDERNYDGTFTCYYMPGMGTDFFQVPSGYNFLNWYCDETGKQYVDYMGDPISGDKITLTANWEYIDKEVTIDGIKYYLDSRNDNDRKATVCKYEGTSENVVIPESISDDGNEYTVTSIGNSAFRECSNLASITIPKSVTSIGDAAFYECRSLAGITIPKSVTSMGGSAFQLSGIVTVYFEADSKLKSIGDNTFRNCSNLTSITIPKSVTSIGGYAFFGCGSLKDIYYLGTEEDWNAISKADAQIPDTAIHYVAVSLSEDTFAYNGAVQKPEVSVKSGETTLTEGTDYTVEWSNENSTDAGTYTVTVKGIGQNGYAGTIKKEYTITAKTITPAVTLSASKYVYNAKMKTPAVTVKDGSKKLVKNTDYTVTYASGRKNVGKYKVTVKMKGNYSGTKTVNFTIKPKKAVIYSAKVGTKQVKVTMSKKVAATGGKYYQIKYRIKGKSSWKTVNTNLKTKTIKSLKKGKRYQIKVRAFKKVSGVTYYGAWSKIKLTNKIK